MKTVTITPGTRDLLKAHTLSGVLTGARELPSGLVEIELDDDVAQLLESIDENPEVAMRAVLTTQWGRA